MSIKETIFIDNMFSSPYIKEDSGIYLKRIDSSGNRLQKVFYNTCDYGIVFSAELDVPMYSVFKKQDGHSEFVITNDGLYERRGNKWENITNSFDRSEIFQYWTTGGKFELIGEPFRRRMECVFGVGSLIRGINNNYSITNTGMLEAIITEVIDDNSFQLQIRRHHNSNYVGQTFIVKWLDLNGKPQFELIG